MTGQVNTMPGPATRLKRPKRMTTARSHSITMCTEEAARAPSTTAITRAARPMPPARAWATASTSAQTTANTMTVNATAPLREVRLRPVSSRAPVCGILSCRLGEFDEASAPCFLRVMGCSFACAVLVALGLGGHERRRELRVDVLQRHA